MKMKIENLFPPVESNLKFREQLKLEILEVYGQQRQPRFNWRWLITPGVTLASLLLVFLVGNRRPFSLLSDTAQFSQPELTQTNVLTQSPSQVPQDEDSQSTTKLETTSQNLDQLDQELAELSDTLSADADLEAAIAFENL